LSLPHDTGLYLQEIDALFIVGVFGTYLDIPNGIGKESFSIGGLLAMMLKNTVERKGRLR